MQTVCLGLLTVALFTLLASVNSHRPYLRAIWSSWKRINGKKYPTVKEEHQRMQIFTQNYMFSRWHNKRFYRGLETYTTALNQFADLTTKEFTAKYLTPVPMNSSFSMSRTRFINPLTTPPDSWDWREMGYVTAVQHQVR